MVALDRLGLVVLYDLEPGLTVGIGWRSNGSNWLAAEMELMGLLLDPLQSSRLFAFASPQPSLIACRIP